MASIKLYDWQQPEADHLTQVLTKHNVALCTSDPGTGKTVIALDVCQQLQKRPLIIAPKSVLHAWASTADKMGVEYLDIMNIEKFKRGNTMFLHVQGKGKFATFKYNMKPGSLIIFDEAHSCGSPTSQNGKLLASAKPAKLKTLLLSATLADSPLRMRALGYLLGMHQWNNYYAWASKNGCFKNIWNGWDFVKGPRRLEVLNRLHGHIFPEYGHRICVDDVPEYPENRIITQAYDLSSKYTKEINEIYLELEDSLDTNDEDTVLVKMLRARQKTELIKVPLLRDLVLGQIEEGHSVVVFVSFRDSVNKLAEALDKWNPCIIIGEQSKAERDEEIRRFVDDKSRVCISTVQAGGVGVSLNDVRGEFPRTSFICPNFSAVDLRQTLGRTHRANNKSKTLQYIVFIAGTVEEHACKAVKKKMENISLLNDGDLTSGLI